MWYVMQVRTGTEEEIRLQCRKKIEEEILTECFIPHYEEKRSVCGKWTVIRKVLFPGYVFVGTEEMEKLYEKLKIVIGLTKLLGTGETIVPLTEEEVSFLKRFGGREQVVGMSEGIIEHAKVIITSGPLQGMEGYIRKIDRHKRRAYLELPMFGRNQQVQVGLEIVEKTM